MKIKIKGCLNFSEFAGILGLSLLALVLMCISMTRGYVVEGCIGLIVYVAILLLYNKIVNFKGLIGLASARDGFNGAKHRLHLLNTKRLFSFTIVVWGVTILLFSMSYLRVIIFPIKLFYLSIAVLFLIFFGESLNLYFDSFSKNKLPIAVGVLGCIYITTDQTFEMASILFVIIMVSLFLNKFIGKIFGNNIESYNDLMLEIINKSYFRNLSVVVIMGTIFTYCFLSNSAMELWKFSFGLVVLILMVFFFFEQIFGNTQRYSRPDEYFYKGSAYLTKDMVRAPKYPNGDWVDIRTGIKYSKDVPQRV